MTQKKNKVLTGIAGEYFVAAELSRLGYLASITLRNTKGVDILCSNSDASKSIGIQVKSSLSDTRDWILNQKSEGYYADSLFYVFVSLNEDIAVAPEYHVVPSKDVAQFVTESHKKWLSEPKRDGTKRKDSSMRRFLDIENKYLNRWDLLELDTVA